MTEESGKIPVFSCAGHQVDGKKGNKMVNERISGIFPHPLTPPIGRSFPFQRRCEVISGPYHIPEDV